MPRAKGNDLCEIFGYAPDDVSANARKQWKSQDCPFVGKTCIKHSHPQDGTVVVYGSCSVVNKLRKGEVEEVIICPQRLYANGYASLKSCVIDAFSRDIPVCTPKEYSEHKKRQTLPDDFVVLLGKNSGREISLSNPGVIKLSLDWVMARLINGKLTSVIPCEVQSIDITGNYRDNWRAYSVEAPEIPDSNHGMNWANVWKRLIPQLILKSSIAATSKLCRSGIYFVIPNRVYVQFEKLVGDVPKVDKPEDGILNVMTYELGPQVTHGSIRTIVRNRTLRMSAVEFAKAFASGKQLPLGVHLEAKVQEMLNSL